jgi:hypothetical protein
MWSPEEYVGQVLIQASVGSVEAVILCEPWGILPFTNVEESRVEMRSKNDGDFVWVTTAPLDALLIYPRRFPLLVSRERDARTKCTTIRWQDADNRSSPQSTFIIVPLRDNTCLVRFHCTLQLGGWTLPYLTSAWRLTLAASLGALVCAAQIEETFPRLVGQLKASVTAGPAASAAPAAQQTVVASQTSRPDVDGAAAEPSSAVESPTDAVRAFFYPRFAMPDTYAAVMVRKREQLLKELLHDDGWTKVQETRGVVVDRKELSSGLVMGRGTGEVNAPCVAVPMVMGDIEKKPEWDDMFKSGKVVEEVAPGTRITYQEYKGQAMVSGRETVMISFIEWIPMPEVDKRPGTVFEGSPAEYTHALMALSYSVEHRSAPIGSGNVRANCDVAGPILVPLGPTSCRVRMVISLDLNGWIPSSVKRLVATKQPLNIANVRDYLNGKGQRLRADMPPNPTGEELKAWKDGPPTTTATPTPPTPSSTPAAAPSTPPSTPPTAHVLRTPPTPAVDGTYLLEHLVRGQLDRSTFDETAATVADVDGPALRDILSASLDSYLTIHCTHHHWRNITVKKDVVCTQSEVLSGARGSLLLKAVAEVGAPPAAVAALVCDALHASSFDRLQVDGEVESSQSGGVLRRSATFSTDKCPGGPLRLSLLQHRVAHNGGRAFTIVATASEQRVTSMQVLPSGYLIVPRKGDPRRCIVSYAIQLDTVPRHLAERVLPAMRETLVAIRGLVQ